MLTRSLCGVRCELRTTLAESWENHNVLTIASRKLCIASTVGGCRRARGEAIKRLDGLPHWREVMAGFRATSTLGWLVAMTAVGAPQAEADDFPPDVNEMRYQSRIDQTSQPALVYSPSTEDPVPLLVALHTWSGNYRQDFNVTLARECVDREWAWIQPDFRGPNKNRLAGGSDLAVADVEDAVEFMRQTRSIDDSRIYLVGASGGGHMALLMAGRSPHIWAAVSAWVPISDLAAWYHQCRAANRHYADDIVACCGGPPEQNETVDREYRRRSPLTHLSNARRVPIDINAGIHDGHTGSVPVSQSLRAFNALVDEPLRFAEDDIDYITANQAIPAHLQESTTSLRDLSYGEKPPLLRRSGERARVTLFEGGHEMVSTAAIAWLSRHHRPNP